MSVARRTALFNWLFARQQGGTYVLRIEDTDALRNRAEHAEGIERAMLWLGLDWDEGPYFQSERGELYEAAIDHLLAKDLVYACDCNGGQVAERNKAAGRPPVYDGYCRDRGLEPARAAFCASARPTPGTTSWPDIVRGEVVYENSSIEDFSIRKSNGQPLFILANVGRRRRYGHKPRHPGRGPRAEHTQIPPALGGTRTGSRPLFSPTSHFSSTSRGKSCPSGETKSPSRTTGTRAICPRPCSTTWRCSDGHPGTTGRSFRRRNSSRSSAWKMSSPRQPFSTNRNWRRSMPHISRAFSPDEFVARAGEWLTGRWAPIAPLVQERARTLAEVYSMVDFLYAPEVKVDQADWDKARRQQPAFVALLGAAEARYEECDWEAPAIREATLEAGAAVGISALGKAQAPVRLAVTGRSVGPPLFESLVLLGRRRTLARLAAARVRAEVEDRG